MVRKRKNLYAWRKDKITFLRHKSTKKKEDKTMMRNLKPLIPIATITTRHSSNPSYSNISLTLKAYLTSVLTTSFLSSFPQKITRHDEVF